MDYKYIEQLLERYWNCETSLEEEQILRSFFRQKEVPAHLLRYKQLFVLNTILLTQSVFNPRLTIEGILLTMLDQRTNLGVEVSQEVRKYFKEKVYKTAIPRNIKLSEAPSEGLAIFDYDNNSEGARAYRDFAKEVCKRNAK